MDVNIRSAEMWEIINHDGGGFKGLTVVDFGCGYGDLLAFVLRAGASQVMGVDKDQKTLNTAALKCNFYTNTSFYCADFEDRIVQSSILDMMGAGDGVFMDVAFCTSVLPYLKDPGRFVYWLSKEFDTTYIECQYKGDGPGNIAENDDEMSSWLLNCGFKSAIGIGKTYVEGRDLYRTIWECW
jgi:predicted RNA methylase